MCNVLTWAVSGWICSFHVVTHLLQYPSGPAFRVLLHKRHGIAGKLLQAGLLLMLSAANSLQKFSQVELGRRSPFVVTGPCSCTWTKSWTFVETAECLNHITECDSAIVVLSFLLYKLGGTNHLGAKGPDSSYCRCSWKTTRVLNCFCTISRNYNKLESARRPRCLVTASFQLPVDITNDRLCSLQIPGQVHECNCRNWQDSIRLALLSFIYIHEHSVDMNIHGHSRTFMSYIRIRIWNLIDDFAMQPWNLLTFAPQRWCQYPACHVHQQHHMHVHAWHSEKIWEGAWIFFEHQGPLRIHQVHLDSWNII